MDRILLALGWGTCPVGTTEVLHNMLVCCPTNRSIVQAHLRAVSALHPLKTCPKLPSSLKLLKFSLQGSIFTAVQAEMTGITVFTLVLSSTQNNIYGNMEMMGLTYDLDMKGGQYPFCETHGTCCIECITLTDGKY